MVTIGLSRTVSEINGDVRQKIERKSPIFPPPRVFNAPAEGVPLGILYRRRGLRKLLMWLAAGSHGNLQLLNLFSASVAKNHHLRQCRRTMH